MVRKVLVRGFRRPGLWPDSVTSRLCGLGRNLVPASPKGGAWPGLPVMLFLFRVFLSHLTALDMETGLSSVTFHPEENCVVSI